MVVILVSSAGAQSDKPKASENPTTIHPVDDDGADVEAAQGIVTRCDWPGVTGPRVPSALLAVF